MNKLNHVIKLLHFFNAANFIPVLKRANNLLFFTFFLLLVNPLFAQEAGKLKDIQIPAGLTLPQAISIIEKQTGVPFAYNEPDLSPYKIKAPISGVSVQQVLFELFSGTPFTFDQENGKVVIYRSNQVNGPEAGTRATRRQARLHISGTVTDSLGERFPGVSIKAVNWPSASTATDEAGRFTLQIPADTALLRFTLIGYQDKEVSVKRSGEVNVIIRSAVNNMEEVVVVGYGTQKKASVVGAVQTVKPSELMTTSANLTTAFAGKIAGMISVQRNGAPGADGASFWIRGISTFGTNTSPLIILDGVEIVSEMLNSIAPESIESFSILKDATATALYGSRGANGVLLITTKSGSQGDGRMMVNLRAQTGVSTPTRIQEIADGVTYMEDYNEARRNNGQEDYYSQDKIDGTRKGLNPYVYPNNDWYHTLFKDNTLNQNVNVSVSGGGKKVDYFLNAAFYNESGIIKDQPTGNYNTNVGLKRYMFQSNVSAAITPTTRIGVRMNTQLNYRHLPYTDVNSLFGYTMLINQVDFPAVYPISMVPDGDSRITYYGNAPAWDGGATQINPLAALDRGYSDTYLSYLTTVFNFDQDLKFITNGLKAKVLASFYNKTYSSQSRYNTPFYKTLSSYTVDGAGNYNLDLADIGPAGTSYLTYAAGRDGAREYSLQGSLEYSRQFLEAHDVNALLVYHQKQNDDNGILATESGVLPHREQGLAGRLTYGYKSRYLAEFNFGYNGSENFIAGKRFGFFPSIAAGWNISNEPFFSGLKDDIHYLKIRASWGKAGNDALPIRFPYLSTVTTGSSIPNIFLGPNLTQPRGISLNAIGNPEATWEESTKINLGLEVGLFHDLMLVADFFSENRTGIFMQRRSIPNSAGYDGTVPYANIGAVKNKGIDATLDYNKKITNDLSISFKGAFTFAHNEVTARDEPALLYPYMSVIGHPINTVFGLVSEGLFADQADIDQSPRQTFTATVRPGDIKYKDMNSDGVIDDNDATALGSPTTPEIIYGFGPSVKFKRFDLSFYFQGAARVSLLMSSQHPFTDGVYSGYNISQWIADDHWSESNPNPNAAYPRLSYVINQNNVKTSSFWTYNASFLRLKTAEAGYTYKGFRFYISGTNLLTFSGFKYWDPEQGGGNGLAYPLQRTYNFGLQYNF